MSRSSLRAAIVAFATTAMLLLPQAASAQNTYTAGGTDNNWSTLGNFSEGVPQSGATTALAFNDTVGTGRSNNDLTNLQINSLTMTLGITNPLVITGNTITFTGAGAQLTAGGGVTPVEDPVTLTTTNFRNWTPSINARLAGSFNIAVNKITAGTNLAGASSFPPDLILNGGFTGSGTITRNENTATQVGSGLFLNNQNNTSFTGTYIGTNNTFLTGINALGRGATLNTGVGTGGVTAGNADPTSSVYPQAPPGTSQLAPGGATQQIGTLTGSSGFFVGDGSTVANGVATALIGFSNTDATFAGIISLRNAFDATGAVSSHFGKVGTGTQTLTASSTGTRGTISVRDGTLLLSGTSAALGTTQTTQFGIQLYAGATLSASIGTAAAINRFQDSTIFTGLGGKLIIDGSAYAGTSNIASERLGDLNVASGQTTIQINTSSTTSKTIALLFASGGSATGTLRLQGSTNLGGTASLFIATNNLGGALTTGGVADTANVRINGITTANYGSNALFVGGAGVNTYGASTKNLRIAPFITTSVTTTGAPGLAGTFVTYDVAGTTTTSTLRGLADSNYNIVSTIDNTVTGSNVSIGAAGATLSGNQTINSLRLNNLGTLDVGANTLTITSGALLVAQTTAATIGGTGALTFSNTAFVTTNGVGTSGATIAPTVNAPNFSKNGPGALSLTGILNLTGTTGSVVAVNSGTLNLGEAVTTSNPLSLTNKLTYQVATGATLGRTAGFNIADATVANNTDFTHILQGGGTQYAGTGTAADLATVNGNVTVGKGGLIRPSTLGGNNAALASPGILNLSNNLTLQAGGTYEWYASSIYGESTANGQTTNYTQSVLNVAGNLDLTGINADNKFNIKVSALNLDNRWGKIYDAIAGEEYTFKIATFGSLTGTFNPNAFNVTFNAADWAAGTQSFVVSQQGNSLYLTAVVPEPATTLAIAVGGFGLIGLVRRRLTRNSTPTIAA